MIDQVLMYRCSLCGKVYDSPQQHCSCETKLTEGDLIGPFLVRERKETSHFEVECCICGMIKTMHSSNIRKQSSCGCKPRHVDIIRVNAESIRYKCNKCHHVKAENLPIDEWCCDD